MIAIMDRTEVVADLGIRMMMEQPAFYAAILTADESPTLVVYDAHDAAAGFQIVRMLNLAKALCGKRVELSNRTTIWCLERSSKKAASASYANPAPIPPAEDPNQLVLF